MAVHHMRSGSDDASSHAARPAQLNSIPNSSLWWLEISDGAALERFYIAADSVMTRPVRGIR
jgi:hypothetical protein